MTDAANAPNGSPDQNHVPGLPLRDLAGFTHRWVDAEGIRLHAVEGGRSSGPTVVLLAGFPQTWWAWHKAMPRLAERFHVIAIDLPGQGYSDRPQGSYDTHTAASRVQAALTTLNVPKYWLVGHDIGACVAFSLALRYQDRLHGVALLDSKHSRNHPPGHHPGGSRTGLENLALGIPPGARTARDADHRPRT